MAHGFVPKRWARVLVAALPLLATVPVRGSAPPPPTLVSPTGAIATALPTYVWSAEPGVATYMLDLRNSADAIVTNFVPDPASAGCASGTGTCSQASTFNLPNGTYTWTVRSADTFDMSVPSAPLSFTIAGTAGVPPPAPVLTYPLGTIAFLMPSFDWDKVDIATSYRLVVRDSSNAVVVDATATPASVRCTSSISCVLTIPGLSLPNGSYAWTVTASNLDGARTSAPLSFTLSITPSGPPAVPVTVSPSGTITTATPTYTWNASAGATSYYLLAQNTAGVAVSTSVTATAAGCGAGNGTCSVTPSAALPGGATYNWFVNATNSAGTSAWSAATTINVSVAGPSVPPAAPTLLSPSGTITANVPPFSWTESSGATSYRLVVQNMSGVFIDWTTGASSCSGGVCMAAVGAAACVQCSIGGPLAYGGTYSWFVSASNDAGTSPWSAGNTITLSGLPLADAPVGSVTTTTPTFGWYTSDAPPYRIVAGFGGAAQSPAFVAIDVTLPDSSMCTAPMGPKTLMYCRYAPAVGLAVGTTYSWTVRNAFGSSSPQSFTVTALGPPPVTPYALSPTDGASTDALPTYTWTSSPGATSYYLLVQNTQGVAVGQSVTPAAAGCAAGGDCSYNPGVALTPGTWYSWFVNASNSYGTSPWSNGHALKVLGDMPPTPESPSGTIDTTTPTYTWTSGLPGPYYLLVQNTAIIAISQWVSPACVFTTTVYQCSFTPSTALTAGATYNWFVSNGAGWSMPLTITVGAASSGSPPATPTQRAPSGLVSSPVGYTWDPAPGATDYDVLVQNTAGVAAMTTVHASDVCGVTSLSCVFTASFLLTPGVPYNWFVKAGNAAGESAWAGPLTITLATNAPPPVPSLIAPAGAVSAAGPYTFSWLPLSSATLYQLVVQNTAGLWGQANVDSTSAGCASGTCTVTVPMSLPAHSSLNWFVKAQGPAGESAWGGPLVITTP